MERISAPERSSIAISTRVPGFFGSAKTIDPLVICADLGNNPMIACEMVVLPEPDSPTRATVSCAPMRKLTFSTALTRICGKTNSTFKSRIRRISVIFPRQCRLPDLMRLPGPLFRPRPYASDWFLLYRRPVTGYLWPNPAQFQADHQNRPMLIL